MPASRAVASSAARVCIGAKDSDGVCVQMVGDEECLERLIEADGESRLEELLMRCAEPMQPTRSAESLLSLTFLFGSLSPSLPVSSFSKAKGERRADI